MSQVNANNESYVYKVIFNRKENTKPLINNVTEATLNKSNFIRPIVGFRSTLIEHNCHWKQKFKTFLRRVSSTGLAWSVLRSLLRYVLLLPWMEQAVNSEIMGRIDLKQIKKWIFYFSRRTSINFGGICQLVKIPENTCSHFPQG